MMCGIAGCVLKRGSASRLIREALKRLEYRGYDSAGIATAVDGLIHLKKGVGRIDEIHRRLDFDSMPGSVGIGHTRWATHGAPAVENAHPHTDCRGRVAVVHNGVIENFTQIRSELIDKGHKYLSRTDSEVFAHLVEEEVVEGESLYTAVQKSLSRIKGSYSIAVISADEPDKIVCARNESPLITGISKEGAFCTSDIPALMPFTKEVTPLGNGEIAVLKPPRIEIRKISNGILLERKPKTIDWSIETAERQGYTHFMLKEIHEQPFALKNAMRIQESYLNLIATFLDRGKEVFLVGAGTSYHACLAASIVFSKVSRLVTYPVIASEFIDMYGDVVGIESVVLALSQSGETYDVLKAVDYSRMRAATVLGLTNNVGSTLTRVSRAYLVQQSGPEIGVAATKTFTAQLITLTHLALTLAKLRGKSSQEEVDELKARIREVPNIVEEVIKKRDEKTRRLAKKYASEKLFLFLGKGVSLATALEGRLKLMEITYIPSLSYPAGESKHGPISVVEEGTPAIFIAPPDEARKNILGSIMEMKARGAKIITVCDDKDEELIAESDEFIGIPETSEILSPITYIIPLQLFAYHLAVEKGLDPDKPRNLAKSVTVP